MSDAPAFGFCEYGNPDSALRAIRLLHDYEIADRKLVVKADAKTEKLIEEYKGEADILMWAYHEFSWSQL